MSSPTDQELLDAYRNALMALSTSQSYRLSDGREVTKAQVPQITAAITWLEQRIAAASTDTDNSGFVLINFRQ